MGSERRLEKLDGFHSDIASSAVEEALDTETLQGDLKYTMQSQAIVSQRVLMLEGVVANIVEAGKCRQQGMRTPRSFNLEVGQATASARADCTTNPRLAVVPDAVGEPGTTTPAAHLLGEDLPMVNSLRAQQAHISLRAS